MLAVKVCHLLNQPEDAFYFMEKNKALLLLEKTRASSDLISPASTESKIDCRFPP